MSGARSSLCALDPSLERRPGLVWVIALGLTALGAVLRFHDLGGQSLWIDEMFGATWVSGSVSDLFDHLARDRWKPPLDYLILHRVVQWGGMSEACLRTPAAVWGCLLPLVVLGWFRSACGPTVGLTAMGLIAVSPLHVRYSQDATPYSLYLLLVTLSLWALWELANREESRTRWWAVFTLSTWAALWTLFLTPLIVCMEVAWVWGVWLFARRTGGGDTRRLAHTALGVTAVSAVGLASVLIRLIALTRAMTEWSTFEVLPFTPWTLADLMRNLGAFAFGAVPDEVAGKVAWLAIPLLAVGAVRLLWRRPSLGVLLPVIPLGSFVGVLIMCVIQDHWYAVRYPVGGLTAYIGLLAVGVVTLSHLLARMLTPGASSQPARVGLIAGLLGAGALIGGPWAAHRVLTRPPLNYDWRALVEWLEENTEQDDRVLAADGLISLPMEHYTERMASSFRYETISGTEFLTRELETFEGDLFLWNSSWPLIRVWDRDMYHRLGRQPVLHRTTAVDVVRIEDQPPALLVDENYARHAALWFEEDGHRLEVGDERFVATTRGWSIAEHWQTEFPFRWTGATTARVLIPLTEPRECHIAFRATTYHWQGAPPQLTCVRVNGHEVARGVIETGWSTYTCATTRGVWQEGLNLIEIEIDHAVSPASVVGSDDTRPLGIGVDWIELSDTAEADHDWTGSVFVGADLDQVASAARRIEDAAWRIEFGDEVYPAAGEGWHVPDPWDETFEMRWSRRTRAEILVPLAEPRDWDLTFRATAFHWPGAPPQRTTVRLNGVALGAGEIQPGWSVYGLTGSSELWRSGLNVIEFESDHVASPEAVVGSPDPRPLGIGVDWVQLIEGLEGHAGVDHVWAP